MAATPLVMEFVFVDSATPKAKAFQKQLNKLVGTLKGADTRMGKVNRTTKTASSRFTKLNGVLKRVTASLFSMKSMVGGLAVSFGLMRLKDMIANWVNLSSVQQQSELHLKFALKSMGKYTEEYHKNVMKTASVLQVATGVGDEAIMDLQVRLMRLGVTSRAELPKMTSLALDLAAAFKEINVQRAGEIVGGLLSGETRALSQMRKLFGKGFRDVEGGGSAAMLDFIKGQVGGVSELKSYTIAWNNLKAVIGDLSEGFGDFFNILFVDSGIVETLREGIDNLTVALKDYLKLPGVQTAITASTEGVVSRLEGFTEKLKEKLKEDPDIITKKIKELTEWFGKLWVWIKWIGIGIGAIFGIAVLEKIIVWTAAILKASKILGAFMWTASKTAAGIVATFSKAAIAVGSRIKAMYALFVSGDISAISTMVGNNLSTIEIRVALWLSDLKKLITASFAGIFKSFITKATGLGAAIGTVLAVTYGKFADEFKKIEWYKDVQRQLQDKPLKMTVDWEDKTGAKIGEFPVDIDPNQTSISSMLEGTTDRTVVLDFAWDEQDMLNTLLTTSKAVSKEVMAQIPLYIEEASQHAGMVSFDMVMLGDYEIFDFILEDIRNNWSKTITSMVKTFEGAFSKMLTGTAVDFEDFSDKIETIFMNKITSKISERLILPVVEKMIIPIIDQYFPEAFMGKATPEQMFARVSKALPALQKEIKKALSSLKIKIAEVEVEEVKVKEEWKLTPHKYENVFGGLPFEGIDDRTGSSISDMLNENLEFLRNIAIAEKELTESRIKNANEMSKVITEAWKDNVHDALMSGELVFKNFANSIKSTFTKKFTKDMFSGFEKGLSELLAKEIKVGDRSTTMGGMIGGGITGYQIGTAMGGTEESQAFGAIGGAIGSIYGPAGAMAGSVLGSMIGNMIGETEKTWEEAVPPNIDVLFEVVNGKLEESGKYAASAGPEIRARVKELVQAQIDTLRVATAILGEELESFTLRFTSSVGRIAANAESGFAKSYSILANMGNLTKLLSDEAMANMKEELAKGVYMAGYKGFEGEVVRDPWVGGRAYLETMTTAGNELVEKMMSGSVEGAELYMRILDEWRSGHSAKGWAIMTDLLDVFWGNINAEIEAMVEKMSEYFGKSISDAFTTAINTIDPTKFLGMSVEELVGDENVLGELPTAAEDFAKGFGQSLKRNIYEGVKAGLVNAFKEKLYLNLMNPLFDNLKTVFDQIEDISNMTTTEAESRINVLVNNFDEYMEGFMGGFEKIEPLLETFYFSMMRLEASMVTASENMLTSQQELVDSMVANRELIDDWIREMRGGEESPVVSMEWMQGQYQALLDAAQTFGTSEDIQKLLDFTQGTYLPFMEAASFRSPGEIATETTGAYKAMFEDVITDIEALAPTDEEISMEVNTLLDILTELGLQTDIYEEILARYGDRSIGDSIDDLSNNINEALDQLGVAMVETSTYASTGFIPGASLPPQLEPGYTATVTTPTEETSVADMLLNMPSLSPFAGGGLTTGPSMAGESGPEWVVPTYEPQRSSFLQNVGVDPEKIGKAIARELVSVQSGGGGEIHVHVDIDSNEIGRAFVNQAQTNPDIRTTIKEINR